MRLYEVATFLLEFTPKPLEENIKQQNAMKNVYCEKYSNEETISLNVCGALWILRELILDRQDI